MHQGKHLSACSPYLTWKGQTFFWAELLLPLLLLLLLEPRLLLPPLDPPLWPPLWPPCCPPLPLEFAPFWTRKLCFCPCLNLMAFISGSVSGSAKIGVKA